MSDATTSGIPILYSRRSDGGVQTWQVEVEGGKFRTTSGIRGGNLTTSAWTQAKGKQGRSDSEQAEKEARALWTKKKDEGYWPNEADIDTQAFFSPMLAEVFEDREALVKQALTAGGRLWVQPKFDGMRCIAQRGGLTSRNGKPIVSAPHVHAAVVKAFAKFKIDFFVTDGELYAHKFANDFNKIISLAKKQKPTAADLAASAETLQYHIYDLPHHSGGFTARYNELLSIMSLSDPCIQISPTVQVGSMSEIEEWFAKWRQEGYEGLMIRFDQPYQNKRSRSLLKYKVMSEEDYTVLDVHEGEGNRAGMAGAMEFATAGGTRFTASIMGNMELFRRLLADKAKVIGKVASIQFQNLTPAGVPRFPYVKAIRDYE
jgi:DNA ligase-1